MAIARRKARRASAESTAARRRARKVPSAGKRKPSSGPRPASKRRPTGRSAAKKVADEAPHAVPGLGEEDQIRAAKYLPREMPRRLFEEERFLFPGTYGVDRVRLLVRDPEWLFAYWDVDPVGMKDLGRSLGERGLALSRLTLRVIDPVSGGSSDILLPPGARWWYIRTDAARRTYRAELGVTLPSGEFRRLAQSNTVVTPRVGPSPEPARRRMSYREAKEVSPSAGAGRAARGGASDVFRPGGASDTYRR